jgi:NMD protein affecting ribosome stability and mRNA decay
MSHHAKGTRLHPIGAPLRGRGVMVEREHDAYRERLKLAEPALCPECRAVFQEGRWQWKAAPAGAYEHLCPACRRIRDHFPAGFVTLEGEFFRAHRQELMQCVQAHADHARAEHPLQRLMDIEERGEGVLITTTETHLARGIGEALHHAYRGELRFNHERGQTLLRVHWRR